MLNQREETSGKGEVSGSGPWGQMGGQSYGPPLPPKKTCSPGTKDRCSWGENHVEKTLTHPLPLCIMWADVDRRVLPEAPSNPDQHGWS